MSTSPSKSKSQAIQKLSAPKFSWQFLLPKYWLVWLGAGCLYLISCLPYAVLMRLGKLVGKLIVLAAPKRARVAKQNIRLCFPDWNEKRVNEVYNANIARTGMALFETAMGWWWPRWRIQAIGRVEGYEHVEHILAQGKGVFGLAIHNVNLELACRILGYTHPCIAFYRKHNNPLMDYFQYHGRSRSNKYMVHKRNSKALINAMNQGELCVYLPDQDYGAKQSIFVPFGGVAQTATTTGTLMFVERANCVPLLIVPQFDEKGYVVKIYPAIDYLDPSSPEASLTRLNQDLLAAVEEQAESYLWMHKRFKTRPPEAPESLYER